MLNDLKISFFFLKIFDRIIFFDIFLVSKLLNYIKIIFFSENF